MPLFLRMRNKNGKTQEATLSIVKISIFLEIAVARLNDGVRNSQTAVSSAYAHCAYMRINFIEGHNTPFTIYAYYS